eukprot:UN05142
MLGPEVYCRDLDKVFTDAIIAEDLAECQESQEPLFDKNPAYSGIPRGTSSFLSQTKDYTLGVHHLVLILGHHIFVVHILQWNY